MLLLPTGMVAPTQRTIPDFVLERPVTAAEAVAAGATRGAVYAQGCSDLFAQFREGLDCRTLVSLERISELGAVEWDGSTLEIGAGVDHHAGRTTPGCGPPCRAWPRAGAASPPSGSGDGPPSAGI